MKSYTDLEQSRKLAEILPLESADMIYIPMMDIDSMSNSGFFDIPECYPFNEFKDSDTKPLPCWSLSALMDVLPSVIKRKGKRMFLTLEKAGAYNLYYKSPDRLDELWETKEEPIYACVSMIENLHEQKLL
jgi:hypothetical protein